MSLSFAATLAERGFDVAFELAPGETLAVLGPNGAGKSTLLTLIAGLLAPTAGRAELDGTLLFDAAPARRVLLESRRRGVSMLAQEPLLFPHLTVLENVAFGPRSHGRSRALARTTARGWLERIGMDHLAHRKPTQLSGGQAQRVAVARALAVDPALLLLDEPLAALDVTAAPALRRLLRDVLTDRSAIIVTHDPLDAFLLADRILILEGGRVVESGPTQEVLTRPTTAFGARLAGLNLVPGRRTASGLLADNGLLLPLGEGCWVGDGRLAFAIRPARVSVSSDPPADVGWSVMGATIEDIEHRGDLVRVHAGGMAADVAPADVVRGGLAPGVPVFLGIRHADAVVYPVQ